VLFLSEGRESINDDTRKYLNHDYDNDDVIEIFENKSPNGIMRGILRVI
jgi:hypothetical protein